MACSLVSSLINDHGPKWSHVEQEKWVPARTFALVLSILKAPPLDLVEDVINWSESP